MAGNIQFDAASNSGYQAASGSYSWSHTCSGINRILVVSIALLNVANDVATLTYAGVAMTRLRSDVDGTGTIRTDIYYLLAPATGSNSIAITLNSASVSAGMASSYKNVSQYAPVDAQDGTTGTTGAGGGSSSISTTVVTEGAWLVDAIATTDTSITVGAGQNQRSNVTGAVGSGGQSDRSALPAGSQAMAWDNIGALLNWTASTIALYPATIQGTTTSISSTSSTSSSISSTSTSTTSVSTSSTSSSVSTSSISTSSTSSSISTSSTSSSISSTSSSTSSTSLSSTSSSTSISSTSSSISSTSISSTSTSSTSSSTSVSSISTSFSSTSSSQSSTSASTSSTSFSSTSSSSSTSSTTVPPPPIDYSYQDSLTVPATGADLINKFTTAQYSDVGGDDEDYFIEYGSEYMIRNYQRQGADNTSTPQFTWRGRSTVDTRVSPVLIQIYNNATPATIDSYSEANQSSSKTISGSFNNNFQGIAQSFTGNGAPIGSASLYLKKLGLPTGTVVAKIYAHSGTFGTSSVPIGTALAISDTIDISTLTTTFQLITLNFGGINQITLTNGTNYVLSLETASGDLSNNVLLGTDNTSPTHGGNLSQLLSGAWGAQSGSDVCFYIYDNTGATWETLAVANTVPPDTDFSVTVSRTTNVSNYYDSSNMVTFRSYQQVI